MNSSLARRTLALAVLSLAACSSSSSATTPTTTASADVTTFCTKAVSCGLDDSNGVLLTQQSCLKEFEGWLPPATCASQFAAAQCSDIAGGTSVGVALQNLCEPPCSPASTSTCNGAQITECTSAGATVVFDCNGVCAGQLQTYTGTCGVTYNAQTSASGQPVCWCK